MTRVLPWLGLLTLLSSGARAFDGDEKPLEIRVCRQVVVAVEDHGVREMGERVGAIVCEKAKKLTPLFGLSGGQVVLVRVAKDMISWHKLTGQSFYTIAVFMSRGIGDMILTQPADQMKKFGNLEGVLTHELVHLMVRRSVGRRCPTWLNEGLAQWYEGRRAKGPLPADERELEELEKRWHSKDTPVVQKRKDYRASVALVGLLVDQVGEETLMAAVRKLRHTRNVLSLDLEGRDMSQRLFTDRPRTSSADDSDVEIGRHSELEQRSAGDAAGGSMTELPLDQMLKKAKKKKPKNRKK